MSRHLADLTRRHVRDWMARGLDTVVVPVGATEQHGEAMPFGTDTIIGELIAEAFAEKIDAVVAPALPYGVSIEHMATSGSVTLRPSTLISVLDEITTSFIGNGFSRVVLLVAHFGNAAPAELASQQVTARTGATVLTSNYFAGMEEAAAAVMGLPLEQLDWSWFYSHGGAAEAALVMAHDPSLVDGPAATPEATDRPSTFYDPAMKYPQRVEEGSPAGHWGDPRSVSPGVAVPVTASLGSDLIAACADRLANRYSHILATVEQGRAAAGLPATGPGWWTHI